MSDIPAPEDSPNNEWIRSVAQSVSEDEQTLRAIVSASHEAFQPPDSEKNEALQSLFADIYYKTSETPFDNSPQGRVWIQFPHDGDIGAHYEYACHNPPHPAPNQMDVAGGRNWTYVTHTVTAVDSQVRDVMQDIDHYQEASQINPSSQFGTDEITVVRGVDHHPDFATTKRILTDGFGIDIVDVQDAWGKFTSEWRQARVYWNDD